MQPTDDSALLQQYAKNQSDEAFATLVTRHVNLVYSVALRHVGNARPHPDLRPRGEGTAIARGLIYEQTSEKS
jgi:hypothetical protein